MHCTMRKPRTLKVRRYRDHFIEPNKYLYSFHEGKLADNIGIMELDEIFLNSTPNSWSKKAYVQRFYFKYIDFKKAVNIFKRMEIAEYIYKFLV